MLLTFGYLLRATAREREIGGKWEKSVWAAQQNRSSSARLWNGGAEPRQLHIIAQHFRIVRLHRYGGTWLQFYRTRRRGKAHSKMKNEKKREESNE